MPLYHANYTAIENICQSLFQNINRSNDIKYAFLFFVFDLTLESSAVACNTDYAGAFVAYSDNAISVELNNCHLIDSTVTSNKYAGGLIGYVSGTVTIKDCSVEGSAVTGESVGALAGMFSTAQGVETATVTNTTVTGNTMTSLKNGSYRVGELVGTANVEYVVLTGITTNGNTCTQAGSDGFEANMVSTAWIGRASSNVTGDTSAKIN